MNPRAVLVALALLGAGGCAYVPPLTHQFNASDLNALEPGRTTRAEAERRMHNFARFRDTDRLLICEKTRHAGYGMLVGPGGGIGGPLHTQSYRMLMEFDAGQVLRRLEVEEEYREHDWVAGQDTAGLELPAPAETLYVRPSLWEPPRVYVRLAAADSCLAAVDRQDRLWLWSAADPREPVTFRVPHRGSVRAMAIARDGHRAAFLSGELAVVELPAPGPGMVVPPHGLAAAWTRRGVRGMALAGDGSRIAVVDHDRQVLVLDARDGRTEVAGLPHPGAVVTWSPDGRRLAILSGNTLWICRPDSGGAAEAHIDIPPCACAFPPAIAFSPTASRIAIHVGSHVELWDLPDVVNPMDPPRLTDAFLLPYPASRPEGGGPDPALAFTRDGRGLVVGNGRLEVIALDGSRRRWRYARRGKWVAYERDLAIEPWSGRLVATSTRGLFVWRLPG